MAAMSIGDRSRSGRVRERGDGMEPETLHRSPGVHAPFQLHREALADIAADPAAVFAVLDDHRRLSAHMEKSSLMMAGATMKTELDSLRGQAVGSVIRMKGVILGVSLHVEEVVAHHEPPFRKTWETRGEPRLLVIGRYRMGFELSPAATGTRLRVWIDYGLPTGWAGRLLGTLLAGVYADWCVTRMARDATKFFNKG
jgi:hypothetical protein